ncbi:MFS transporter [Cupriavidus sp. 2TAF22]|uniref:MFS transporter n=1 Tax=unclassified Cupriavidus TaxID=2640874 RepID=UPI003F8DD45D
MTPPDSGRPAATHDSARRPGASVDVQQFIDSQPFSRFQWMILVLCFLIVAADGFDTAAIGFIAPVLAKEWGIARAHLGPVLSAALFGLAAGALVAGPLADRFGRKRVLVGSVLCFGAWSAASAFAGSIEALTALRFLTGLGLGAAMPNAVTLMSEYAPARRRSLAVNAMFCGFTLGSSAGGFIAAWLIPHHGWHSVLLVGGVAPLMLAVLLMLCLPESVRFMVARRADAARIAAALSRIRPGALRGDERFHIQEQAPGDGAAATSSLRAILMPRFAIGTVLLWTTYFMGLLIFYLLTSWLPTLISDAGFPIEKAALVTALFPLGGGIGTLAVGWLMDRGHPWRIVAGTYALTGALVYAVGHGAGDLFLLSLLVFAAGTCMNGAQSSMPTLAAGFYPTQCRATGVAWMLGIGRFGGIAGALLGAQILSMGWSFGKIFGLLSLPAFVATIALLAASARYSGAHTTASAIASKTTS